MKLVMDVGLLAFFLHASYTQTHNRDILGLRIVICQNSHNRLINTAILLAC